MTSICSVILAFMLSIGGGGNLGVHLSEKPHPGLKIETRELRLIQTELNQEQQPVLRFFIRNSRLGVRFLQTDPMGYEDSLNLYQAFNQNLVNFSDPMGRQTVATSQWEFGPIWKWMARKAGDKKLEEKTFSIQEVVANSDDPKNKQLILMFRDIGIVALTEVVGELSAILLKHV